MRWHWRGVAYKGALALASSGLQRSAGTGVEWPTKVRWHWRRVAYKGALALVAYTGGRRGRSGWRPSQAGSGGRRGPRSEARVGPGRQDPGLPARQVTAPVGTPAAQQLLLRGSDCALAFCCSDIHAGRSRGHKTGRVAGWEKAEKQARARARVPAQGTTPV